MACCSCCMNRREFIELTVAGTAAVSMAGIAPVYAGKSIEDWDPDKPLLQVGRALRVQPVLMYTVSHYKKQRSFKSWGGIQDDQAADQEVSRIGRELHTLAKESAFPIEVLPVMKVKTVAEAEKIHRRDVDTVIVYPARGSGDMLRACISKEKDTLIFARKRSGPVYYWYEALSVKYLQTAKETTDEAVKQGKHVHVDDVVIDEMAELAWRLRALYAVKNFRGTKIVTLGGPWGKYSPQAPDIARDKFSMDIVDVSYDDLARRIKSARNEQRLVQKSKAWARQYLSLPQTTLKTDAAFVENCFVLYWIFKDLMREHQAHAFTIRDCMATIMPMSETTACLTLGLLNDEGYMAFCESDFVIIPPGVLLRHIAGKPVFLHNSTFPHNGEVTCAHCIGPRRMDGVHYNPTEITTHYESEYGAAPKVSMPEGQELTFIDPEYSTGRWLGFTGKVIRNPYYEICRSQQDVQIAGDWQRLKSEVRDSHWVNVYGNFLAETGYAVRKLGLTWDTI
jgi:L-fucose isomerase-like protein